MNKQYLNQLTKNQLIQNFSWNIGGSFIAKAIGPILSIFIARILSPSVFGIYGIALAIITLLEVFKDAGLQETVIVSPKNSDYFSIQFSIQLLFSVTTYIILWFTAPFIAEFYNIPDLSFIIKLMTLSIFFSAIEDPIVTQLLKQNNYKKLFFRQIIPSLSFGILTLVLAVLDFKIMALVYGYLLSRFLTALFFFISFNRIPKIYYPKKQIKKLVNTSKHIVFQRFMGYITLHADALIIAKFLGKNDLGLYKLSKQLTYLVPSTFISNINQVVFTDISAKQADINYLRKRYFHFTNYGSLFSLLFSIAFFWTAPFIIPLVLGEKWTETVPLVQLYLLQLPLVPLTSLNKKISLIFKFNYIYTYFNLVRISILLTVIFITANINIQTVVLGWCIIQIIFPIVNMILFYTFQKKIAISKHFFIIFFFVICNAIIGIIYNFVHY